VAEFSSLSDETRCTPRKDRKRLHKRNENGSASKRAQYSSPSVSSADDSTPIRNSNSLAIDSEEEDTSKTSKNDWQLIQRKRILQKPRKTDLRGFLKTAVSITVII
jgi:hypothetical protein